MAGKVVDGDDNCAHTQGAAIGSEVRAGVVDHLVALMGEERRGGGEKPPIGIQGGIVNIPNGGRGSTKRHHPQHHRRKSWHALNWRRGSNREG